MTHFEIKNKMLIDNNSPYNYSSHKTSDQLEDFLTKTIESIKKEKNPRLIVLETWLMLDFAIRQLIIWGIGADINCTENFDLRNELLPTSFKQCLDFLISFRDRQKSLSINPSRKCLELPHTFWRYIYKEVEHKDIVLKAIFDYQKKMNPNYIIPNAPCVQTLFPNSDYTKSLWTLNTTPPEFRTVDDRWLEVVSYLDSKWVKKVNQINNARNKAAHFYNQKEIFKCFGINGFNQIEVLKKKCLESISFLLKINLVE